MSSQLLLDILLQLPELERLMIASRLLETLPDYLPIEDWSDDQFAAELDRRSNDWHGAVSWEDLKPTMQVKSGE